MWPEMAREPSRFDLPIRARASRAAHGVGERRAREEPDEQKVYCRLPTHVPTAAVMRNDTITRRNPNLEHTGPIDTATLVIYCIRVYFQHFPAVIYCNVATDTRRKVAYSKTIPSLCNLGENLAVAAGPANLKKRGPDRRANQARQRDSLRQRLQSL